MDFQRASREQINNLIEKYNKLKQRCSLDLDARENNVKQLVKDQVEKKDVMSKLVLYNYLTYEIKPLLDRFEGEDKEVLRHYFRFISKQKTIRPGVSFG